MVRQIFARAVPTALLVIFSVSASWGGTLFAWGENSLNQCRVPSGDDFLSVSGGGVHASALRADGSLASWGWDYYGVASPPYRQRLSGCECGRVPLRRSSPRWLAWSPGVTTAVDSATSRPVTTSAKYPPAMGSVWRCATTVRWSPGAGAGPRRLRLAPSWRSTRAWPGRTDWPFAPTARSPHSARCTRVLCRQDTTLWQCPAAGTTPWRCVPTARSSAGDSTMPVRSTARRGPFVEIDAGQGVQHRFARQRHDRGVGLGHVPRAESATGAFRRSLRRRPRGLRHQRSRTGRHRPVRGPARRRRPPAVAAELLLGRARPTRSGQRPRRPSRPAILCP